MSSEKPREKIDIKEVEEVHTEKVLEYINNPRNLGIMGNYDGKGETTAKIWNQLFTLVIYIKVSDDTIQRSSYFSDSLGGLIHAYGSALTEMIKGKTIREVLLIRPEDISGSLGLSETEYGSWFKKTLVEAINDYNVYKSAAWKRLYEKQY
jgi:NifU-like protein involved in Fe-S cluster formation